MGRQPSPGDEPFYGRQFSHVRLMGTTGVSGGTGSFAYLLNELYVSVKFRKNELLKTI